MKRTVLVVTLALLIGLLLAVPAFAARPPELADHQSGAAELKGDVADLMPGHVVGDQPGGAHQSGASSLKGEVADLVPEHV